MLKVSVGPEMIHGVIIYKTETLTCEFLDLWDH